MTAYCKNFNREPSRPFDVTCAAVGLLLLWPFFLLIAIAIKLDDGGPVFYKQLRVGKHFRLFGMLKFRSMVIGADGGSLLTREGDSRITRVGRQLRRYKLDELPQLLNVLRGEMQLVGARPEVERYVQHFRREYACILQQAPGITDPASLAYRHEDRLLSTERREEEYIREILPRKLALSVSYQQRRSFLSDLGILCKTVFGIEERGEAGLGLTEP